MCIYMCIYICACMIRTFGNSSIKLFSNVEFNISNINLYLLLYCYNTGI